MIYKNTVEAIFIDRPNRFIAHVHIKGQDESLVHTVHVKNTGRCKELLYPGVKVVLSDEWAGGNPNNRKTQYDLIAVYKESLGWINIDSQVPNKVVFDWLKSDEESRKKLFPNLTYVKPEFTYGNSRMDFYLEDGERKVLIEVKGCTLEIDGVGYFPDAPTTRGVKHLNELTAAIKNGYESYIAYVIAMPGVSEVRPNSVTDPAFAKAYENALANGVHVMLLTCEIMPESIVPAKVIIR